MLPPSCVSFCCSADLCIIPACRVMHSWSQSVRTFLHQPFRLSTALGIVVLVGLISAVLCMAIGFYGYPHLPYPVDAAAYEDPGWMAQLTGLGGRFLLVGAFAFGCLLANQKVGSYPVIARFASAFSIVSNRAFCSPILYAIQLISKLLGRPLKPSTRGGKFKAGR
jgi:hypothetical protein